MKKYVKLLRVDQWVKNLFVFTPLIFSQHLLDAVFVSKSVTAFIAFCIASSIIYVINDIADVNVDKLHPNKKLRPIASGEISISRALVLASVLLLLVLFISLDLSKSFLAVITFYLVIQVAYSLFLKKVVILDLFTIASGFMLRVFAGAFAIDVVISHWIIITTLFLSLFLAASKRRSELMLVQSLQIQTTRRVLGEYSIDLLNAILFITATGMSISYALYTMAEKTIQVFHSENLIFSTVFVLFGIFRYLYLVMVLQEGENPSKLMISDKPTLFNLILWFVYCIFVIYYLQ